jgi:RHS repeat-associated protein
MSDIVVEFKFWNKFLACRCREGRYNSDGYRYGFNGKENDNEVKGEGNQQDYGMRVYDPRLARFLSVDPIAKEYPELTPYQFASNRCIDGIDLDGLEFGWASYILSKTTSGYSTVVKTVGQNYVQTKAQAADLYQKAKVSTQNYYVNATGVIKNQLLAPANALLSSKFEVKATFGPQVGLEGEFRGNKLGADLTLASMTVAKYSAEQQKSDNGPTKLDFYIF